MLAEMADHVPVLLHETLELLAPQPGESFVDATFGAGGHARALAERLGPRGLLIAIDRDPDRPGALRGALAAEVGCPTRFVRADFADGPGGAARARACSADGVLLDLGVSSMQVDTWERGFSYSYDAPLDMRMDPRAGLDARDRRQRPGTSDAWRARCASSARSATPVRSRAGSCAPASARRSRRRTSSSSRDQGRGARPGALRRRPSREALLPGDPHRRQRRAGQLDSALPSPGRSS